MVVTVSDLVDLTELDYRINERVTLRDLLFRRRYVDASIGMRDAREMRKSDFDRYRMQRREDGAAENTINHELNLVRRGYRLAILDGLLETAPRIEFFRIGLRNARTDFLRPSEFDQVLEEVNRRDRAIGDLVEFLFVSGWRRGEAVALEWSSISDDAITLSARDTKEGKLSSRGHARFLPLIGRLAEVMDRRRTARTPEIAHVFHRAGKPVGDFRKLWRSSLRAAGLNPKTVVHALRRSFCIYAVDSGLSPDVVRQFTGHRTPEVFSRYNICDRARLVSASKRLSDYLASDKDS